MSTRSEAQLVRCAIYTRKSSEEGLDQHFNSLHAQREACEAYVLSQAGSGWKALPTQYDDGGFSGGTMERPALKRLLADIAAGKIDTVVVYKIDRLTRSLTDFAKIVDQFEAAGASFVSVTQAFNTTTSMGRLTLNVLLSFAQFEREVTGERIRDKIAASKSKGMWMGGSPPLGYDKPTNPVTRALVVNAEEAKTVRLIFQSYMELKSVSRLQAFLAAQGVRSKSWVTARGRSMGGYAINRGALIHLLKNRVYLGEITGRAGIKEGAHPAIVEASLFDAVQAMLSAHTSRSRKRNSTEPSALLARKIYDAQGRVMSPAFSIGRGGRRYRYYVSAPLQQGEPRRADDDTLRRVPAPALEEAVREALERVTRASGANAFDKLACVEVHPRQLLLRIAGPAMSFEALKARAIPGETVEAVGAEWVLNVPAVVKTRGGRSFIERPRGQDAMRAPKLDRTLLKGLVAAHKLAREIGVAPGGGSETLRQARGATVAYQRMLAPLAFLSPEIQQAVVEGRQPAGLQLSSLLRSDLPLAWADQKKLLGF